MSWNMVGTRNRLPIRSRAISDSASAVSNVGMQTKMPFEYTDIANARIPIV